jgi:hypothetical protein
MPRSDPESAWLRGSGRSERPDVLADVSARGAIALLAAFGLALAVWETLSPAIRAAPALSEI